jgi:hypothetical protein
MSRRQREQRQTGADDGEAADDDGAAWPGRAALRFREHVGDGRDVAVEVEIAAVIHVEFARDRRCHRTRNRFVRATDGSRWRRLDRVAIELISRRELRERRRPGIGSLPLLAHHTEDDQAHTGGDGQRGERDDDENCAHD